MPKKASEFGVLMIATASFHSAAKRYTEPQTASLILADFPPSLPNFAVFGGGDQREVSILLLISNSFWIPRPYPRQFPPKGTRVHRHVRPKACAALAGFAQKWAVGRRLLARLCRQARKATWDALATVAKFAIDKGRIHSGGSPFPEYVPPASCLSRSTAICSSGTISASP